VSRHTADDEDDTDFHDPGDTSTRLFDLRFLIGGLFTLYGIIVGVAGLLDSAAELKKADGVRINLWTGIGMLILGLLFLLWAWRRPLQLATRPTDGSDGSTGSSGSTGSRGSGESGGTGDSGESGRTGDSGERTEGGPRHRR
jgi:uncharacterized membrane protein YgcG